MLAVNSTGRTLSAGHLLTLHTTSATVHQATGKYRSNRIDTSEHIHSTAPMCARSVTSTGAKPVLHRSVSNFNNKRCSIRELHAVTTKNVDTEACLPGRL